MMDRTWTRFPLAVIAGSLLALGCASTQNELADDEDGDDGNEVEIAYTDLPAAVKTAFEKEYPGAEVDEAEMETSDDGTTYGIEFAAADGKEMEAEFSATGQLLESEVADEDDDD